ncbi:hypothetical protein M446_6717 [Methylobacterium sp. 4-46]|uniref:hypothetical protein n=1 Tax=unclassified Methylobacterium TaxID=2615210 RepID=UPI000152D314|nr:MULTISPECIES: hypothetical protein [Methylobacterium]ACA20967.1 hypothetical protein M446_6717 [Methylobacterium sp. 4-46]WFT80122.1 hypothetical protein QA634_33925 [Methylobacterium nodulans]
MDVDALLREISRRIVEIELRSTALAARVAELASLGLEAGEVEQRLWAAIDALTVLRCEQWTLQGLRGPAGADRADEILARAAAYDEDAEARLRARTQVTRDGAGS